MDNLEIFDDRNSIMQVLRGSGTGAMTVTLDNAAAVDAGSGQVTIPSTSHGLVAGTPVYISGTTAYDGLYEIVSVATDTFNIYATYTAETFAGTETAQVCVAPMPNTNNPAAWEFDSVLLHLSAAGGTSEDFTVSIDANAGTAHDVKLLAQDMETAQDVAASKEAGDFPGVYGKSDRALFAYTNTNGRTWGLAVWIRRKR